MDTAGVPHNVVGERRPERGRPPGTGQTIPIQVRRHRHVHGSRSPAPTRTCARCTPPHARHGRPSPATRSSRRRRPRDARRADADPDVDPAGRHADPDARRPTRAATRPPTGTTTPAPTGSAARDDGRPGDHEPQAQAHRARRARQLLALGDGDGDATARKGERTLRTLRLQVRGGEHRVKVRRLRQGPAARSRSQARDAAGNRSRDRQRLDPGPAQVKPPAASLPPARRRLVAARLHAQRASARSRCCARSAARARSKGDTVRHLRAQAAPGRSRRSRRSSATCRSRPSSRRCVSDKGVDVYDVDIREGLAEILPGFQTPIYGYDGIYPGPTIRARKGRAAIVRQHNQLSFDSNVHLHGGYVPAAHDGHPMDVIAPGGSFDYSYPNDQDAAFLWYHDHAHGRTARTLYYGLVGTYLLARRARARARPARAASTTSRSSWPTTRSTRTARSATRRTSTSASAATRSSSTARSRRGWRCERRIYRLRFLNASNARSYELQLGSGRPDGADRQRRRPARAAGQAHGRSRCTRPSGSRSLDRLPQVQRRLGGRAAQPRAARRARARHALRRRAAAASEEARIPTGRMRHARAPARAQRDAPLGPRAADARAACSGRSPAAASTRRASTCGRGSARRSCGSGATRPSACTRCTCTGCSSASSSAPRASSIRVSAAGRTRSACCPGETVTVQPWFAPVRGPLRLPLPRARARRQGDDAPAGGGLSAARGDRAAAPALALAGGGARRSAADVRRSRRPTRSSWDKPRGQGRRSATRSRGRFEGTTRPQRRVGERELVVLVDDRRAGARLHVGPVHGRRALRVRLPAPPGHDVAATSSWASRPRRRSPSSRSSTTAARRALFETGEYDDVEAAPVRPARAARRRRRPGLLHASRSARASPPASCAAARSAAPRASRPRATASSPSARA